MPFVKFTKRLNAITGEIASWVIFLMMLLAVADAVGRYTLHITIFGAQDLTQLMMVVVVFLGFGLLAEEDGNVRIEILYQKFSPKLKAIMNIFAWVIGIVSYSFVAYRLLLRALSVFENHNATTITLNISLAPFLLIASVGCILMILQLASNIILNAMTLMGKDAELKEIEEGGENK